MKKTENNLSLEDKVEILMALESCNRGRLGKLEPRQQARALELDTALADYFNDSYVVTGRGFRTASKSGQDEKRISSLREVV